MTYTTLSIGLHSEKTEIVTKFFPTLIFTGSPVWFLLCKGKKRTIQPPSGPPVEYYAMRLPFVTGLFLYPMAQNFDNGTGNPLAVFPTESGPENPLANGTENPLADGAENPLVIESEYPFENGNDSVEEPGQDATALLDSKED